MPSEKCPRRPSKSETSTAISGKRGTQARHVKTKIITVCVTVESQLKKCADKYSHIALISAPPKASLTIRPAMLLAPNMGWLNRSRLMSAQGKGIGLDCVRVGYTERGVEDSQPSPFPARLQETPPLRCPTPFSTEGSSPPVNRSDMHP